MDMLDDFLNTLIRWFSLLLDLLLPNRAAKEQASAESKLELLPLSTIARLMENEAATKTKRVQVVIYDPLVNGDCLSRQRGWDGSVVPMETLSMFLDEVSGGEVKYSIDIVTHIDKSMPLLDGYVYSDEELLAITAGDTSRIHVGSIMIDYMAFLEEAGSFDLVNANEIDEVWAFGFPWAGFYESRMVGPNAFWVNAPLLYVPTTNPIGPSVTRNFVMMGFNYERGLAEAAEAYAHRVESIMFEVWRRSQNNLWTLFTQQVLDKPAKTHVGSVHFPPNGRRDYDWDSKEIVESYAPMWLAGRQDAGVHAGEFSCVLDCSEWDCSAFGYMYWWLSHIPRNDGLVINGEPTGNWWEFIADVNKAAKFSQNQ